MKSFGNTLNYLTIIRKCVGIYENVGKHFLYVSYTYHISGASPESSRHLTLITPPINNLKQNESVRNNACCYMFLLIILPLSSNK